MLKNQVGEVNSGQVRKGFRSHLKVCLLYSKRNKKTLKSFKQEEVTFPNLFNKNHSGNYEENELDKAYQEDQLEDCFR